MQLLTVKDISTLLNIKEKTIYQWTSMNQIPFMKINGCLRFDQDEINEWLKNARQESVSSYNNGAGRRPLKGGL